MRRALELLVLALPCIVTVAGCVCGAVGLALQLPWLLIVSLAADVLDGWLARKLNATTRFGADLDYCCDVGLAFAGVALVHAWPVIVLLGIFHAYWPRTTSPRFSGRASVFAALCLVWWW